LIRAAAPVTVFTLRSLAEILGDGCQLKRIAPRQIAQRHTAATDMKGMGIDLKAGTFFL
jgi:hypothetical protein